jgi:DNA-binding NarL/FixJ family response regulator
VWKGRQATPQSIRVVIADDHDSIRGALRQILAGTEDIHVVATVADGRQAIATAAELAPDVILMDIGMPGVDGLEATRRIVLRHPAIRIVTLTGFHDHEEKARQAGAAAHMHKDTAPEELISCIRAVAAR